MQTLEHDNNRFYYTLTTISKLTHLPVDAVKKRLSDVGAVYLLPKGRVVGADESIKKGDVQALVGYDRYNERGSFVYYRFLKSFILELFGKELGLQRSPEPSQPMAHYRCGGFMQQSCHE